MGSIGFGRLGLCMVAALVVGSAAVAEEIVFYAPDSGETVRFDSNNIPKRFQQPPGEPHLKTSGGAKAGNATFNLTFTDVTNNNNIGFDDPTYGATRQATALAVATYVNAVLNSTPASPPTIDVIFEVSQTDGGGALATAGTFWFLSPNRYDSGFAFEHLTTGVDPDGGSPDIYCTFDFGFTWNSDLGDPAGSEFDLATVLLHELTHGLGFVGLADANGNSTISGGSPGVFTLLDAALERSGGTDLWNDATFTFLGTAADLISDDVVLDAPNAVAAFGSKPPMFAPSPFAPGSSLSHFDDNITGASTVIMTPFVANGVKKRAYSAVEIGALIDIGYDDAAAAGEIGQAPVVTVNNLTTNDTTPTLTGTINDAAATISVTVNAQNFAGTNLGATWTATVPVALADGTYDVAVAATNGLTGNDATTNELTVDATGPTVTLTSGAGDPVSAEISVSAALNESSVNFVSGDVTPTNAVVTVFSGSGTSFSFTLTPLSVGSFSAIVNAGALTDALGNSSTASNTLSRTFNGFNSVFVDFAFGGTETGDMSNPFNTLAEGVAAVATGGGITLKGDTGDPISAETIRITKALTLNSLGGAVRVGVIGGKAGERVLKRLEEAQEAQQQTPGLFAFISGLLSNGAVSGDGGSESEVGDSASTVQGGADEFPPVPIYAWPLAAALIAMACAALRPRK